MAGRQWRCYHCDEVFRSEKQAGIHFGATQAEQCACLLSHEQHLVEHIRDLEGQLDGYRDERDKVLLSILSLEGAQAAALRQAEERGYDKAVQDMKAQGYCVEPNAHAAVEVRTWLA